MVSTRKTRSPVSKKTKVVRKKKRTVKDVAKEVVFEVDLEEEDEDEETSVDGVKQAKAKRRQAMLESMRQKFREQYEPITPLKSLPRVGWRKEKKKKKKEEEEEEEEEGDAKKGGKQAKKKKKDANSKKKSKGKKATVRFNWKNSLPSPLQPSPSLPPCGQTQKKGNAEKGAKQAKTKKKDANLKKKSRGEKATVRLNWKNSPSHPPSNPSPPSLPHSMRPHTEKERNNESKSRP
jgi:hypothetical protein